MKAQVLITSTSASSALEVISMPRSNTLPSMISASTRFFAQPRLIIPPLAALVAVVAGPSPAWSEELPPTRQPLQKTCSLVSLSCYLQIGVAVGDDLAVLANLHGFTIEHAHAEAVTAEFDCSIGRRNPPFKCRLGGIVVNRYLHVSPF